MRENTNPLASSVLMGQLFQINAQAHYKQLIKAVKINNTMLQVLIKAATY